MSPTMARPVDPAVVVRPATPNDLENVERLLSAAALPLDGVREHLDGFVVAERGGSIVGCAAVERYATAGLLRSVAVDQAERSNGTGAVLVEQCIANAADAGIDTLILLTTTAELYFPRFGFEVVDRSAVPEAVRDSAEFRGACPASATVMRRHTLTKPTNRTAPLDAIACDMSAIPADERDAHVALARSLFFAGGRMVRETEGGLMVELPPDLLADTARFVENERRCCRHLAFTLEVPSGNGDLVLRVTGPGARDELVALCQPRPALGSPRPVHDDADAHEAHGAA